jgi:hypothetical protein
MSETPKTPAPSLKDNAVAAAAIFKKWNLPSKGKPRPVPPTKENEHD